LDWLAEGKEIFDLPGVMLHLPEQWGTQPYFYTKEAVVVEQPVLEFIEDEENENDEEDDTVLDN
jgi:hypothetical protein